VDVIDVPHHPDAYFIPTSTAYHDMIRLRENNILRLRVEYAFLLILPPINLKKKDTANDNHFALFAGLKRVLLLVETRVSATQKIDLISKLLSQ